MLSIKNQTNPWLNESGKTRVLKIQLKWELCFVDKDHVSISLPIYHEAQSFDNYFVLTESDKLQQDLQKVEQLEEKINSELAMLKEKIATMEKDLVTYSDLSTLKENSERKRKVSGELQLLVARKLSFTFSKIYLDSYKIERFEFYCS